MSAIGFEDLNDFLDADEFADVADVLDPEGVPVATGILGIFDDPYLNAELGEYDMDTSRPRFGCKLADLPAGVARGHQLEINGELFSVLTEPEKDGTGWAQLDLARVYES